MGRYCETGETTRDWLCPRDAMNPGRQTVPLIYCDGPANNNVGEAGKLFFQNSARFDNTCSSTVLILSSCMTENLKVCEHWI